jgi:integrase/recombinase XerD
MSRHRHPFTVGLPLAAWPGLDRAAWERANREGDLLAEQGPAATWRFNTRRTAQKAYGNWLRFLRDGGRLDLTTHIAGRLSEVNLRDYIAALRDRASPNTVLTQLRYLSSAVAVMDPSADRSLLNLAISRLVPLARPARNKAKRLVSPVALLQLGQKLMAGWQARAAHDPRLNAMDYRDGLMIAFLALCPVRVANLAAMQIGKHLSYAAGRPRVAFDASETKGKQALEFDFPADLTAALSFYLGHVHSMLCGGAELGAPLWPSLHKGKPEMTAHGIYTRITQITAAHLGHPVTPHMFRDAAATFIAEMTPERAMMAAAVLQHRNLETTMRHYIHGQQHRAARKYHAAINDLIARGTRVD